MKITFTNGSIYRLGATDRKGYNKLVGINPRTIIYDEYSLQNPLAREYLTPVLVENGGREILVSTVRGQNHLHQLYKGVIDSPEWFVSNYNIEQTFKNDGTPVVNLEDVELARKNNWSEDKIQQEFYNDFTAIIKGALFSKELSRALDQGRIRNFAIDTRYPVHTFWDLGKDGTAVWFVQQIQNEFYFISYYENIDEDFQHFAQYLSMFQKKYNIMYGKHFGPHDVTRGIGALKGVTYQSIAKLLGIKFERIERVSLKFDSIEAARGIMGKCVFHKENCEDGLRALEHYHLPFNEKLGIYGDKPVHDWASHGSDAFQQFALWNSKLRANNPNLVIKNDPSVSALNNL